MWKLLDFSQRAQGIIQALQLGISINTSLCTGENSILIISIRALLFLMVDSNFGRGTLLKIVGSPWLEGKIRLEVDNTVTYLSDAMACKRTPANTCCISLLLAMSIGLFWKRLKEKLQWGSKSRINDNHNHPNTGHLSCQLSKGL